MSQDHPGDDNDRQDPEMAAMLSRIRSPEHGDDFWATLRTELQAAGMADTGPEETAADDAARGTMLPMRPPAGNGRGSRLGRDWRRWTLAAAAAVVVVALVGAGYLATRDGNGNDTDVITPPGPTLPSNDPTPSTVEEDTTTTTTTPVPPGSASIAPVGGPIDRGPGRVVAVDPTSRFVYIADAAPEGGQGCEGSPRGALYVEPIEGGNRTLIVGADTIDATTPPKMRFDGQGGVAVVTQCEGFGAAVRTSTIQSDGTFGEITEIELPGVSDDEPAQTITDIAFRRPGVLVAATSSLAGDGTRHPRLLEFPIDSSEVNDLGVDDALWVDADPEGRLAIYTLEEEIRYEGSDTVPFFIGNANDISISSSGALLAVTGETGTTVIDLATGDTNGLPEVVGFAISYVDESLVIFERFDQGLATAVAFHPEAMDAEPVELVEGEAFGIVVAPDLSRVFATQASGDGSTVSIVEQHLERR